MQKKPSQTSRTRKQLTTLTVQQFRQFLENDLRDLPLKEELCQHLLAFLDTFQQTEPLSPRERILKFLSEVPTDPRFWGGLGMAEQIAQEGTGRADQILVDYFSGRDGSFLKHYDVPPPSGWKEAASHVWLVIELLRAGAQLATKKGRPEEVPAEEKRRRKRIKDTEAQRLYSSRNYRVRFQAAYNKGKRTLETKGKATVQNLRNLKEHIISRETTRQAGTIKRKELDDFGQWVENELEQQALRKNSR